MKLGNKGFSIDKNSLTPEELLKHRQNLTVKPLSNPDYDFGKIRPFKIFTEDKTHLHVPRFYGLTNIPGAASTPKSFAPTTDIDIEFVGELRAPQKPIIKTTLETLQSKGGGVICAGCGVGKTVMGLYIISVIGKKTLIIVHKEFLMNQWKERIEEYLPYARVGIIQGAIKDVEDKDIVIGMLQTISLKTDFTEDFFYDYGLTIVDECHRISAEKFSQALPKIASEYMLGLSATPQRADGLSKVFHWYLGDTCYKFVRGKEHEVIVRRILMTHTAFKEKLNFRGKPNQALMLNDLYMIPSRNNIIFRELVPVIQSGRQILILSDRREHLEMLKRMVDGAKICTTGYYVGGMKEWDLKESESKQVIFGTMQMAKEGLDIPGLNTLFMVLLGTANIEQAVGRILRKKEHLEKLIVDFVDQHSCFNNQGSRRLAYYKKANNDYSIVNVFYDKGIYQKEVVLEKAPPKKTVAKKTITTKKTTQQSKKSTNQSGSLADYSVDDESLINEANMCMYDDMDNRDAAEEIPEKVCYFDDNDD